MLVFLQFTGVRNLFFTVFNDNLLFPHYSYLRFSTQNRYAIGGLYEYYVAPHDYLLIPQVYYLVEFLNHLKLLQNLE